MKIVVIGDVHNDVESLMSFLDKVKELEPEIIVFSGDFIDMGIELRGFERSDIARLVIEELKELKLPILAVPGNHDKDVLGVIEEEGIGLHGRGKVVNGVGFYGFGGAKTPFNTPLEPSEEELERGLRKGYKEVEKSELKVQVTHNPPYNTKLDMIGSGAHVGSKVVRKLIEEFQPEAAVCAHIHEARGTDSIGDTKILNAGRFPEGYCGVIDIDKSSSKVTAKVVNLI